jgi:hypothetical protein
LHSAGVGGFHATTWCQERKARAKIRKDQSVGKEARRSAGVAKRIAAATTNKTRRHKGETAGGRKRTSSAKRSRKR